MSHSRRQEDGLTVFRALLTDKHDDFKNSLSETVDRICKREMNDPNAIDILDGPIKDDYRNAFLHFDNAYSKIYNVLPLKGSSVPGDELESSRGSTPEIDSMMSYEERRRCFTVTASASIKFVRGVQRVNSVIGREAQGKILEILYKVTRALRKGLELERIEREVEQQEGRLLEPSSDVVEERTMLGKRKRELEEIG